MKKLNMNKKQLNILISSLSIILLIIIAIGGFFTYKTIINKNSQYAKGQINVEVEYYDAKKEMKEDTLIYTIHKNDKYKFFGELISKKNPDEHDNLAFNLSSSKGLGIFISGYNYHLGDIYPASEYGWELEMKDKNSGKYMDTPVGASSLTFTTNYFKIAENI